MGSPVSLFEYQLPGSQWVNKNDKGLVVEVISSEPNKREFGWWEITVLILMEQGSPANRETLYIVEAHTWQEEWDRL